MALVVLRLFSLQENYALNKSANAFFGRAVSNKESCSIAGTK
jgi:hypothetical protein